MVEIIAEYITSDKSEGGIIIKGKERNNRQPVHIILLLDTSGSMDLENRLISVKKSIKLMIEFMSTNDRISLVTFSDNAKTIISHVAISTDERQAIHYSIDKIKSENSTNLSSGLFEAKQLIEKETNRKQALIVLTDGDVNGGIIEPNTLISIIEKIQEEYIGITISTVGYGLSHNAELLTRIATVGGGGYNIVNNTEDVASVFGYILGGLISISAQNIRIHLPTNFIPNTSYSVNENEIYIGDIYSESEIVVLFKSISFENNYICVTGINMATFNQLNENIEIIYNTNNIINKSLKIAKIREKVTNILINIRDNELSEELKNKIIVLISEIVPIQNEHPILPMLVKDLQDALEYININISDELSIAHHQFNRRNNNIMLSQAIASISMTRGFRQEQDPMPFSSPIQAELSQNMRERSRL